MANSDLTVVFCIPVYNDWESAGILLAHIGEMIRSSGMTAGVVFVDDGSTVEPSVRAQPDLAWVQILRLRRNVGHQRAIAIGLTHLQDTTDCPAVCVMDADGEDRPADVPRLMEVYFRNDASRLVFAKRGRRTEGWIFRLGYRAFKIVHWCLTGRPVEVGNFSVIPRRLLDRLVGVGEVWNHYAAAVYRARFPTVTLPLDRGVRYAGRSHMNVTSLIVHGLSAISVFAEDIGVRMLVASGGLMFATAVGVAAVVGIRFGTDWAVPGWATSTIGLLVILCSNAALMLVTFLVLILQSRSGASFIPLRDYRYFILDARNL